MTSSRHQLITVTPFYLCEIRYTTVYRSLLETPHCLWVLWNAGTRPTASTSKAASKARISHEHSGSFRDRNLMISYLHLFAVWFFGIDFDIALSTTPICMMGVATEISTCCVFVCLTEVPLHDWYVVVPSSSFLRMAPEPKSSSEESESEAGCWVSRGRWNVVQTSFVKSE